MACWPPHTTRATKFQHLHLRHSQTITASYIPGGLLLLFCDVASLCSLSWPCTHNPPASQVLPKRSFHEFGPRPPLLYT
jgi:hypothetical protein